MKWSAKEARRGDTLTLSADISGLPNEAELAVVIYEYDRDGRNDRITELPARVEKGRVEIRWEYEYHEDTDEIPGQQELDRYGGQYNPPEYFFTIKAEGVEYGQDQESKLLKFKDWFDVIGEDAYGEPLRDGEYVLILPDGEERRGNLDNEGRARIADVPPGVCVIEFSQQEEDDADDQSVSQAPDA